MKSGFTLIEILVVIFVATLIGIAVYTLEKDSFSLNSKIYDELSAQFEARNALKAMTSEIRSASPSSIGSYPIEQANSTSFVFYSNVDSDPFKERVRYFLDGVTLKRGIVKPTGDPLIYDPASETVSILVNKMVNGSVPVFNYYNDNYDGTSVPLPLPADIPSIRLVKITITPYTTQVTLRNLKDNL
jgi:prepilin-type N-terminal cleavage/methylation domain-containing protein